jgi:deoxyribodipyrimidine photo-lyase
MNPISIFWFRRDLRVFDNTGFDAALSAGLPVLPLFIFDSKILEKLEDRDDRRVEFIHGEVEALHQRFREFGSTILVEHGDPIEIFKKVLKKFNVKKVFTNHDYEPYAIERDTEVGKIVKAAGTTFSTFKDQVIFERLDVQKGAGGSYSVYTPFSKKWRELLKPDMLAARASEAKLGKLLKTKSFRLPTLSELGFRPAGLPYPPADVDRKLLKTYDKTRNVPSINGTSRMGLHLRFGTVSVRELVKIARKTNEIWFGELIWREFFMQILWNYPHVVSGPFRPEYSKIKYLNRESDFKAWCEGRTGYPIVDAGMRELNETGFMHNRVRMITASFLIKHLLVDWRWGEAYFARRLLDYDLANNNGNWQWVAGCGCDAAPYFRVFNPHEQEKKFDRDQVYAKAWIPELGTADYPEPIVDHREARERVLKVYKAALAR